MTITEIRENARRAKARRERVRRLRTELENFRTPASAPSSTPSWRGTRRPSRSCCAPPA